jgi:hypothetical protein
VVVRLDLVVVDQVVRVLPVKDLRVVLVRWIIHLIIATVAVVVVLADLV